MDFDLVAQTQNMWSLSLIGRVDDSIAVPRTECFRGNSVSNITSKENG